MSLQSSLLVSPPVGVTTVSGRRFRATFYLHVIFSAIIVPLLLPLRTFEVWNAAEIVYGNLVIVGLYLLSAPNLAVFFPTRFFQYLLIYCLLSGGLLGLLNVEDDTGVRNYLSHVFQIFSAYVMFSVGSSVRGEIWNDRIMRPLMLAAIGAEFAAAAAIYGYGIQQGVGGYLVGGGLAGFLAMCYFLPRSRPATSLGFLTVVLSGKRGVLVAAIAAFVTRLSLPAVRIRNGGISMTTLVASAVVTIVAAFTIAWSQVDAANELADWLEYRVGSISTALFSTDEEARLAAAGGRYEEVEAILSDFTSIDWVVGKGFGYRIGFAQNDEFADEIHQVHFSPATLTVRFGLPAAAIFIGSILFVLVQAWRHRLVALRDGASGGVTIQFETTLYYAIGGALISLTAFSIFSDLFFMLFIGLLSGWTRTVDRGQLQARQ